MSSLNICGGDFYSDKLIDLLEQIGKRQQFWQILNTFKFSGERLEELDIYAVGELDMKGVAMLTVYCRSDEKFIPPPPPPHLDLLAGLKALAYVAVSFDLSIELSMLERERADEKWSRCSLL